MNINATIPRTREEIVSELVWLESAGLHSMQYTFRTSSSVSPTAKYRGGKGFKTDRSG